MSEPTRADQDWLAADVVAGYLLAELGDPRLQLVPAN